LIALNGNNNLDEPRASHEMSSASVKSEQLTETALGHNSPQATRIENEVDKEPTRKQAGPTAGINSENHKTNVTTTCKGNNWDKWWLSAQTLSMSHLLGQKSKMERPCAPGIHNNAAFS
jgi:hypothetical protein